MPYVIKTPKGYVKRTSNFGMFHGSIVLTEDVADAYRFTRKTDAERRGQTLMFRTRALGDERFASWARPYSGTEHDKFGGPLSFELEEV